MRDSGDIRHSVRDSIASIHALLACELVKIATNEVSTSINWCLVPSVAYLDDRA